MSRKLLNQGREIIKKRKSRKNLRNIKETEDHYNLEDIIHDLKAIGIKEGDIVMVHSSLRSIGFVESGTNTVINAFLKVIKSEGTLVIPTYSLKGTMYKTCMLKDKYIFDLKTSKTELGAIPKGFLKYEGISRSIHPTHSVSAIGKYAKQITNTHHIDKYTYGQNSPWGKLLDYNGKVMGIGVSLHVNSQYHYLEDILGEKFPLKVKVDEIYKLKCKNEKNEYIEVEVQPLDPEASKTRIDRKENPFIRKYFWEIFEKTGVLKTGYIGKSLSWWVNAKECYQLLVNLANIGITIYSIKPELINKNLYPFEVIKDKLI